MHRFKHFAVTAVALTAFASPGVIKADVTSSNPIVPANSATSAVGTSILMVRAIQAVETPAALHMRVTAYSSTPDQTDDTPFITASGKAVGDGIIASNILPFGTKVRIPELFGDKIFVVEDRMSQKIKNTIDIWMPTRSQALRFGLRVADIVVVSTPIVKTAVAKTLGLNIDVY